MKLLPLITQLRIHDKNLATVNLIPNWAQKEFLRSVEDDMNAGKPVRKIILKARQLGMSTISEATGFSLCMLNEGTQGLVVAHEVEPSQHLLNMTRLFWDEYPFKMMYKTKFESQRVLSWTMGSSLRITSAKNLKAGRGRTIHFLHASEVAFWPKAEETFLGLRQTVPNNPSTMIILESTANGVGNFFHQTWQAAETGDSEYTPLFFPWYKHPEYSAYTLKLDPKPLGALDSEERALQAMGIGEDQLAWRRYAIRNLCNNDPNQFHQEYPTTAEEAFIQSGTNVFPLDKVRQCYDAKRGIRGRLQRNGAGKVELIHDSQGPLKIFRTPSADAEYGQYIIGADPTLGNSGDYSVAQVLNRRTLEQVAIWRAKIDPGTFAQILALLGSFYNNALLVPETEGSGLMTIGALREMRYPNLYQGTRPDSTRGKLAMTYGWSTTYKSKQLAISWLLNLIVDNKIMFHDPDTYTELSNYVTSQKGSFGPGTKDGHDDTVMALAIGCAAHAMDGNGTPRSYGMESSDLFIPKPSVSELFEEAMNYSATDPVWESWGDQDSARI